MWLASPSAKYSGALIGMFYYGDVFPFSYSEYHRGFRPIVCLKSDVQLEKQEDGTYFIK